MSSDTRKAQSRRTRDAILQAARSRFGEDGFERTTIRAIAADAGIDPSMVMRYYGSKQGLLEAAADFDLALPDLAAVAPDELGAVVVRHFLSRWEAAATDDPLRVLLTTATTNPAAAEQVQSIFNAQLQPVVAAAGAYDDDEPGERAGLIATQILGLALCRYGLRIAPVVALDQETVVEWLAPVIQRYLTGRRASDPGAPRRMRQGRRAASS